MLLTHPRVRRMIATWQSELRQVTGTKALLLVTTQPNKDGLTFQHIVDIICGVTEVPFFKVKVRNRKREVVATRQLIAHYSRRYTGMSLTCIGTMLGNFDHTTVIHADERIRGLIQSGDLYICSLVEKINNEIAKLQPSAPGASMDNAGA